MPGHRPRRRDVVRGAGARRRLAAGRVQRPAGHPEPHPACPRTGRWSRRPSFVTGHSYMSTGFSTATEVHEFGGGEPVGQPREVRARRRRPRGQPRRPQRLGRDLRRRRDRSTRRSRTGDRTWLVEGDLAERTLTSVSPDAECPSLSPDGTRVAFKVDVDPGRARRVADRRPGPRDGRAHAARGGTARARRPGRVARRRHPALRHAARRRARRDRHVGGRHDPRRRADSCSSSRRGRPPWCASPLRHILGKFLRCLVGPRVPVEDAGDRADPPVPTPTPVRAVSSPAPVPSRFSMSSPVRPTAPAAASGHALFRGRRRLVPVFVLAAVLSALALVEQPTLSAHGELGAAGEGLRGRAADPQGPRRRGPQRPRARGRDALQGQGRRYGEGRALLQAAQVEGLDPRVRDPVVEERHDPGPDEAEPGQGHGLEEGPLRPRREAHRRQGLRRLGAHRYQRDPRRHAGRVEQGQEQRPAARPG